MSDIEIDVTRSGGRNAGKSATVKVRVSVRGKFVCIVEACDVTSALLGVSSKSKLIVQELQRAIARAEG